MHKPEGISLSLGRKSGRRHRPATSAPPPPPPNGRPGDEDNGRQAGGKGRGGGKEGAGARDSGGAGARGGTGTGVGAGAMGGLGGGAGGDDGGPRRVRGGVGSARSPMAGLAGGSPVAAEGGVEGDEEGAPHPQQITVGERMPLPLPPVNIQFMPGAVQAVVQGEASLAKHCDATCLFKETSLPLFHTLSAKTDSTKDVPTELFQTSCTSMFGGPH